MTTTAEILRGLPYFADLPDDLLFRVCDGSDQIDVPTGTAIIEEGSDSEEMYVVVSGQLVVTKKAGDKEVELARLGPGEVVGEIALLDQAPRTATVTAADDSHLIKVPVAAFEDLLRDPHVTRRMFRTVTSRLRGIEDSLRYEERMGALGRMAAQLMHELNNPAAAVSRSTDELQRLYEQLSETGVRLVGALGTDDNPPPPEKTATLSALDRADAEDQLADWLTHRGVDDPWQVAPALVEAGWNRGRLEAAVADVDSRVQPHLIRWIGLTTAAEQIVNEIGIGARRISELVRVVKDYSYLDQGPIQEIVPTAGIKDTLILLKHKLRGIDVITEFDEDLAKVQASGRDLNQVWTNLIDNAADAMGDSGVLTVRARNESDKVVIEVTDTGHGIPPEVAERIFEPFYTTKEPGKGTGLGLHTVHTIISRVGGDISVSSSPEGTTFTVTLPAVV